MDGSEPTSRPRLVLAAAIALGAAALWVLVLFLPYAGVDQPGFSISYSLLDTEPTIRSLVLGPRLVGLGLVAVTALLTLVVRRPGPWWASSGALLGLTCFCAYGWARHEDLGPVGQHEVAWYLDGLACVVALAAVAIGARSARAARTRPRPATAPAVAVGAGLAAGMALVLMSRSVWFVPRLVQPEIALVMVPSGVRVVAALTGLAIVVVPVLAALARTREATTGSALGWLFLLAPLITHVVAAIDASPDPVSEGFVAGCVVAVLTVVGLVAWASTVERGSPVRSREERLERERLAELEP